MNTSLFNPKGNVRRSTGYLEISGDTVRVVEDNRKPIYIIYILDTSGSMSDDTVIVKTETGEEIRITKIEELNKGVAMVIDSLREFEDQNPLYKFYVQFIELNSYGRAVFPEFQSISRGFETFEFKAEGCTELRASLNTCKEFISDKHLKDTRVSREGKAYNKAVSIILMSDGQPTDCNGVEQTGPAYKNVIDEFDNYLEENGYARNVERWSIAVGADANVDMLGYFCDGNNANKENSRLRVIKDCKDIANALDLATRQTIAHHTTLQIFVNDDDDIDNGQNQTGGNGNGVDYGNGADNGTDNGNGADVDNGQNQTTGNGNGGVKVESDNTLDNLFDGID